MINNDMTGQQLGNYRLLRLLGSGGFGDVYLGEHIHLGTQAAIKVLQTRLSGGDMQSFLQEARIIARLEHPNIIRILEFGVEQPAQIPFLVMTYAPNGTMRQRHPRGSRVPVSQVVGYVGQIAGALQYAHSQRFIHRDIKPENFLIGKSGEVLLSDFGTALLTQTSRAQSNQNIMGTAIYMAPEQLQGRPEPASDQYSLGIVMYEWLSGAPPFQGSFMELYSQHLNVPPALLYQKVPGLSQDIAQVVHRALAKEPRFRFPDMQSLADAFTRACEPTLLHAPAQPGSSPGPVPASFSQSGTLPPAPTPGMSSPGAQVSAISPSATTLPDQADINTPAARNVQTPRPAPGGPSSPLYQQPGFVGGATPPSPSPVHQQPGFPGGATPVHQQPVPASGGPPINSGGITSPPRRPSPNKKTLGILGAILAAVLVIALVVPRLLPGSGTTNQNQNGGNTSTQTAGQSNPQPGSTDTSGGNPIATTTDIAPTPTPSPTPTPPAAGAIIYQATFDAADFGNWGGNNPQQWKIIGNGEIGSDGTADGGSNGGYIIWYQHDILVQNYAVEAKIQFVRNTNGNYGSYSFGLMARGDGNSLGYEGGIAAGSYSCNSSAILVLIQQDNGQICNGALAHVAYTLDGSVHTYRLEVKDNTLKLFLDNQAQPLLTTTDNTLIQPGRVGLRSVYADINILSFKVTAL